MGGIGVPELVIVLVILLLLFGGRKLPELASSLGKSLKEFRRATEEADNEPPRGGQADAEGAVDGARGTPDS